MLLIVALLASDSLLMSNYAVFYHQVQFFLNHRTFNRVFCVLKSEIN